MGTGKPEDAEKSVAAVVRALSLLDAFRADDTELTLAELSKRTQLYKSTILRLIATLERFGYLERTAGGTYRIGAAPLRLASLHKQALHPAEVILAALRAAVEQTGESASYFVRQGDTRILLYRADSPRLLRDHLQPGDIVPLDRGAGSAIFRAFGSPQRAAEAGIRDRMVAIARGELEIGMAGMAAPVFDATGRVAGVVTFSGPEFRFDPAAMDRMEPILLRTVRSISSRLGAETGRFDARLEVLGSAELYPPVR